MRVRFVISWLIVLILSSSARGNDNISIQGTLRDTDGVLLVAGEIRAQRLDVKAKPVVTKTDDRGRYVFRNLPPGTYRVTAYVDQIPQSQAKVQTKAKGWTRLDFKLHESADEGVSRMQQDLRMSTGSNPGR